MSVPSSVDELVQLIRKSGMVDETKLNTYLHRRQAGRGLPPDPREAADAMVTDGILTQFQSEQFLMGKWRGFTVGKYKLLERVGVGGMGQVFLCEHLFMKKRVAVKVLPPAKAEQPAALGRFYREARAAGSLEHPNIVRTHDIDQDGNLHYIVMEYVDGTNLLDLVKKFGPLDPRRAAHYIRQTAGGLDFAFKNGIIHRDIKPGNILIDRHGTAKLLDMGLARFYHDQTDMLTVKYDDKIVLGTADYVAPEQVANSHAVDVRADIYALGASLYFTLAGHPPFPTGTVSQKLLWHRTKDPTPLRQVRPEVPEGLAAIVAKMMQKDPAARYATPAEVFTELERWVPDEVPPPAAEEMPHLCPAAAEPTDGEAYRSGTQTPIVDLKKSSTHAKLSPFAAPPANSTTTPEPPSGLLPGGAPMAAVTGKGGGSAVATRPRLSPPAPVVFGATQDTPNANYDATPAPGPKVAAEKYPFPGAFPVIAMPPAEQATPKRTRAVYAVAAAVVVLFAVYGVYKFAFGKSPAQPVQQVDEAK